MTNMKNVTEEGLDTFVESLRVAFTPNREQIKAALIRVLDFTPEQHAWMTESFLYVQWGKEDARSMRARVRSLCEILGFDLDDLIKEAYAQRKRERRYTGDEE